MTRAGGQFTFVLSQPGRVILTVRNPTGRAVAQVSAGRSATAGLNAVAWSGRDSRGASLPRGRYLVELRAAGETGQVARAVRAFWGR